MKRLFMSSLVLVMLSLASGMAGAKEWKKVRIGVEGAYPPFSSVTPEASTSISPWRSARR